MFIDKTEYCKTFLEEENLLEIWRNNNVLEGCLCNSQLLRKYTDGTWKLTVRIDFADIEISLQEYQAKELINGLSPSIKAQVTSWIPEELKYKEIR